DLVANPRGPQTGTKEEPAAWAKHPAQLGLVGPFRLRGQVVERPAIEGRLEGPFPRRAGESRRPRRSPKLDAIVWPSARPHRQDRYRPRGTRGSSGSRLRYPVHNRRRAQDPVARAIHRPRLPPTLMVVSTSATRGALALDRPHRDRTRATGPRPS